MGPSGSGRDCNDGVEGDAQHNSVDFCVASARRNGLMSKQTSEIEKQSRARGHAYWRANVRIIMGLLAVWALVSLVGSVLYIETLNRVKLGNVPLGFFLSQQGAIYVFVAIIALYVWLMGRLDKKFGIDNETKLPENDAH
jgi:putative solute:sodium symporter small subunit